MPTRREFLKAGGLMLAGLSISGTGAAPVAAAETPDVSQAVEIYMKSDRMGANVWFDPIGIFIEPGRTIRWVVSENVHTTTAYHPRNANHSLRIPSDAAPWDSGYLSPGEHYEVRFTVEGVYDYYCMPHEAAGMVGRIVVGKPAGPGALPFDYFEGKPYAKDWLPVPLAAQAAFPSVERIMRERVVRLGMKED